MTVCITATCQAEFKIVFVADEMLSSDWTSTEGVRKFARISADYPWKGLFAGDDATLFWPFAERVMALTAGNRDSSVDAVIAACEKTHDEQLRRLHEREILAPYGITRDEFVQHGLEWFGDVRFGELVNTLSNTFMAMQLLVAGFDASTRVAHIFELSARGVVRRYDMLGFHAIGVGAAAALSTLYPEPHFNGGPKLAPAKS